MNCLDFRRQLDTDPATREHAFLHHRSGCADCAAAAARAARFDASLREALRVEVPENLAARILLRQSFATSSSAQRTGRGVVAAAASLLLAAGLAAGLYLTGERQSLGDAVFRHIQNEAFALAVTGPVSNSDLASVLAPVGLTLKRRIADVRFATLCMVRRTPTAHLVLEGEKAPITVLLMPEEPVAARSRIATRHMHGILLPAARGSIAIIGASGETLAEMESRIRDAVGWRA